MKFTDTFIHRPVWAIVISVLILILGLRAISDLPINQWPRTENAVVTITTSYYGADAATVAGFITQPLESAIAQAQGIDYLSSSSITGVSTITATLRLNYDSSKALTEINTQVNSVKNQLPPQAQQPVLSVAIGQTTDAMYIGFYSDTLPTNNITDYLLRVVKPKLDSIEGVQTAEILGGRQFALRAWLDPRKMAAHNVSAQDINNALANNNYLSAVGSTKGQMVTVDLIAGTDLHSVDEFKHLVVKQNSDSLVYLDDVATVSLGAENYNTSVAFSGKRSVFIGIKVAPNANILTVANNVREAFPAVQSQLPTGVRGEIVYDSTEFINTSIVEVIKTLAESLVIVAIVIFLFLGAFRAVVVPLVVMPLSLVGTFFVMLLFGYSINLLTLLALVLAIGLVVDDAIIVVESVNRHLEEGMRPRAAAMQAARDLANPIIAMTVVLIAVYVPIGFQGGLTGALFTEFAFTVVGAVTMSAVVALTLSPMMCGYLLKPHAAAGSAGWADRLTAFIDRLFSRLQRGYERRLRGSLRTMPVTLLFAAIVIGSIYFLYGSAGSELAPQEDQGVVILLPTAAPDATVQQRELYGDQLQAIMAKIPEADQSFQVISPALSIAGVTLKPWDQRHRDGTTIQRQLQGQVSAIAGERVAVFQPPPLPGAQGLPIQYVLKTTQPISALYPQAQKFLADAAASGMFLFIDSDLKVDAPQVTIEIDRDKAAQLGLSMSQVGNALGGLLGGAYTNYFSLGTRSYKVISQVQQRSRLTVDQVMQYQIATIGGTPIPVSAIARVTQQTVPQTITHFQQQNSATISGVPALGVSQADALKTLQDLAVQTLPRDTLIDYAGPLRQYIQESSGFLATFALALIVIFLCLAALFESFRDPIVILISIPMSVAGALVFISLGLGGASLNIYTEVGLVTLMGLISKHGILIVEVANEAQRAGRAKLDAIVYAAGVRLRPILMTTAAMVLGVVPLITASGAGAASRFNMGLVIASGLSIGTLFTLFVLPAVYMVIAARHTVEEAAAFSSAE